MNPAFYPLRLFPLVNYPVNIFTSMCSLALCVSIIFFIFDTLCYILWQQAVGCMYFGVFGI